ncbi:MAG: hypothetical protein SGPRY_000969, partial [Prymnesium sp.]
AFGAGVHPVAMVLLQVEVPAGLLPGDVMTVTYNCQDFSVNVPDSVAEGTLLEIDLPVDSPAPVAEESNTTQLVRVIVPDGVSAGDTFTVIAGWGGEFQIVVPDGIHSGDELEVSIPRAPADEAGTAAPASKLSSDDATGVFSDASDARPAAAASTAAAAAHELPAGYEPNDYKFKPGQRVEVWRTGDAYSGGTVVYGWEGWDGPMYKVSRRAFKCHASLKLCYSCVAGKSSSCRTLLTSQVEMDAGIFKEAVPEEEISAAVGDVGDLFDGF